jgi:hypothetical protein
MFKVYAIFDNYKSCYDCADQLHSVYSTKELAYTALNDRFDKADVKAGLVYVDELEVFEN